MPGHKPSKYAHLMNDSNLKRWQGNLARRSDATATVYLAALARFLARTNLDPQSLLALPPRDRDDLVDDHMTGLQAAGKSRSAMALVKLSVASLDWNGQKLERRLRLPAAETDTRTPKYLLGASAPFRFKRVTTLSRPGGGQPGRLTMRYCLVRPSRLLRMRLRASRRWRLR
jgi:hypothetical protein